MLARGDFFSDRFDDLEVHNARRREPRLQNIDSQVCREPGISNIVLEAHSRARALLPIAQCRIENSDLTVSHYWMSLSQFWDLWITTKKGSVL
jgi:hypothetical protein